MKGVLVLFLIGVGTVVGAFVLMGKGTAERGSNVLVVFGKPAQGKVEVNVCIPIGMKRMDQESASEAARDLPWDQWTRKHWSLTSESGETVELTYRTKSNLISDLKAGGAPDGYIIAFMEEGERYKLDYRPDLMDAKRYRYEFVATADLKPRVRKHFDLVK